MPEHRQLTRRQLLQRGLLTAGTAFALPRFVPAAALGSPEQSPASERIRLGVIGTGSRGKYLIANLPEAAQVVAICDCYVPRMANTLQPQRPFAALLERFREQDARRCATYQDYRQLLDKEQLDAVVIATPDHHHILAAMLACQAGLDVYVEKPLSLTIAEGRALVKAVARYGRVVQVGSQQRSMEVNRLGCEFIRNGGIGKVSRVQLSNLAGPRRYTELPEEPLPDGLDWDLFRGPTARRPHHRRLWVKDEFQVDGQLWRGWDVWRDYSGHLMTNWGAHSVDMVQLALGMDATGPVEVRPLTAGYAGELRLCPVTMRYATGVELEFAAGVEGYVFHGERGRVLMSRNQFSVDPPELLDHPPDRALADVWKGTGIVARPHLQNWLDCIKSRQTPHAPVEAGHRTVTICHLANIARELHRPLRWDPVQERFPDDDEANRLLDRPRGQGFELPRIA